MIPALSEFQFRDWSIRTLIDDHGEPWFVAADLCKAIGFSNPRHRGRQPVRLPCDQPEGSPPRLPAGRSCVCDAGSAAVTYLHDTPDEQGRRSEYPLPRFDDEHACGWPAREAKSVVAHCPLCDWSSLPVAVEEQPNAVWFARRDASSAYRGHYVQEHQKVPQPLWEHIP